MVTLRSLVILLCECITIRPSARLSALSVWFTVVSESSILHEFQYGTLT